MLKMVENVLVILEAVASFFDLFASVLELVLDSHSVNRT